MPPPPTIQSLDDARKAMKSLPSGDQGAAKAWAKWEPRLTKLEGSLGRLESLTEWLCRCHAGMAAFTDAGISEKKG